MTNKFLEKIAQDTFKDRLKHTGKLVGSTMAASAVIAGAIKGGKYAKATRVLHGTGGLHGGYSKSTHLGHFVEGAIRNSNRLQAAGIGVGAAALSSPKKKD